MKWNEVNEAEPRFQRPPQVRAPGPFGAGVRPVSLGRQRGGRGSPPDVASQVRPYVLYSWSSTDCDITSLLDVRLPTSIVSH